MPGCRALNATAEFQRRGHIVKHSVTPPLPVSISDPQLEILPVTLRSFHMPQEQLRRLRDFCRDNRQVYCQDWFREALSIKS